VCYFPAMQGKTIALATVSFVMVSAIAALGIGALVRNCTYDFSQSPSAVCGLGVCSGAPAVCTGWTAALWLAPLIGVIACAGSLLIIRHISRRNTFTSSGLASS
jgi:hypothetical protein